jgi:protein SCO1/2
MLKHSRKGIWVLSLIALTSAVSHAQRSLPPVLSQVGIDQRLGEQLPLDARFRDESGKAVQLRDYFSGKPVVLSFAYYTCPMLCPMTLEGMEKVMRQLPFNLGREFVAVNISINPKETPQVAAAKKEGLLKDFDRPGASENWHFLTGDELAIQQVANAAGFHYVWDPNSEQFIHASGIMIATPAGKMARYYYGIEFAERDLRLGLMEAASGRIGSRADQVLLYCFHYDPQTGKYGLAIMRVIRIVGTATVLVLVIAILVWLRRERRPRKPFVSRQPSAEG